MVALAPFNPDAVVDDRQVLPAGNYIAQIIESQMKDTKSGKMLVLTWEILDGPLTKRRVWENLNIINSSAEAQAIAERNLKRICTAVGHSGVLTDTSQIEFKPAEITVTVRPPQGDYGEQNDVKGYKPVGAGGPAAPAASAAPAARPWGQK